MAEDTASGAWVHRRVMDALQRGNCTGVASELRLVGRIHGDLLAAALAVAIGRAGEVRTVTRLAIECGMDRRRLVEQWSSLTSGPSRLYPSTFLRLLVLLRACLMYRDVGSWSRVSSELGVHVRTLRRAAKEVGLDLSDIRGCVPLALTTMLAAPITHVLRTRHRVRLEVFNESKGEVVFARVQAGSVSPGG